jgi:hypothetical protein
MWPSVEPTKEETNNQRRERRVTHVEGDGDAEEQGAQLGVMREEVRQPGEDGGCRRLQGVLGKIGEHFGRKWDRPDGHHDGRHEAKDGGAGDDRPPLLVVVHEDAEDPDDADVDWRAREARGQRPRTAGLGERQRNALADPMVGTRFTAATDQTFVPSSRTSDLRKTPKYDEAEVARRVDTYMAGTAIASATWPLFFARALTVPQLKGLLTARLCLLDRARPSSACRGLSQKAAGLGLIGLQKRPRSGVSLTAG